MTSENWSLVVPIKDEVQFVPHTLPKAFDLLPNDLVIVLDGPPNPKVQEVVQSVLEEYDKNKVARIVYARRNPNWKFQQAWVRRVGYLASKYDKIFTFDIDDIPSPNIMAGHSIIGKDNIVYVSFRKRLVTKGFRATFWSIRYEIGRRLFSFSSSPKPFIGIYWLYKPFYLDLICEEGISQIYNGEDVYPYFLLTKGSKYRYVYLNIEGCCSLREANEDLSWRQYQLGLWLGAMQRKATAIPSKYLKFGLVLVGAISKAQFNVVRGFFAGMKLDSKVRELISSHSYEEMIMYSSHHSKEWVFSYPSHETIVVGRRTQVSKDKKEIQRFWETQPCLPDQSVEDFAKIFQREFDFVFEGDVTGQRVLDLGCGVGKETVVSAQRGAETVAVDYTATGLQIAKTLLRKYGEQADLVRSDIENLPFRDKVFDQVFSLGVIHHTPKPEAVVEELHRALKPKGRLTLMVYNKWTRWFIKWIGGIPYDSQNWDNGCPLVMFYGTGDLKKLLRGFRIKTMRGLGGLFGRKGRLMLRLGLDRLFGWWFVRAIKEA